MNKLKELLKQAHPAIDFDNENALVSNGLLDSIEVVELIAKIEDAFDISVTMEYIQPQYFESAETMWEMIEELL